MRLSWRVKLTLTIWCIAEAIAFAAVVRLVGGPAALLLSVLASVLGWVLLRRAGASALEKLRASFSGGVAGPQTGHVLDDTLAAIGAIAFLIPGFLSDVVGLVLAVPAARDRLASWLQRSGLATRGFGSQRKPSRTIDLERQEWNRREDTKAPIDKR